MTLRDEDILDLPDAPEFISRPPVYSLADFIALCEKQLPYWNKIRFVSPPPLPPGEPFRLVDDEEVQVRKEGEEW